MPQPVAVTKEGDLLVEHFLRPLNQPDPAHAIVTGPYGKYFVEQAPGTSLWRAVGFWSGRSFGEALSFEALLRILQATTIPETEPKPQEPWLQVVSAYKRLDSYHAKMLVLKNLVLPDPVYTVKRASSPEELNKVFHKDGALL